MTTYGSVQNVLQRVWHVVEFSSFESCPEVNSVGIFGNTALKIVITWGDLEAVKLLVESGADINARLERGDTPLHHAVAMGQFPIARYLVSLGANQEIKNIDGKLAKDVCWEGEWESIFGVNRA